jgi:acetyltransferase-like isoleucine patch superfamily enzyme
MALVKRSLCQPNVRIGRECLIEESKIGAYTYVSDRTKIFRAEIGKFCSIGPGCRIGLGIHPTNHISTSPAFFSTMERVGVTFSSVDLLQENKEIMIGNDVWVGANAIILDGIAVGSGSIVGAGSVVTRDVAPYTFVGGVPAIAKKKRFSDEQIERLLQSRWWDWSTDKLRKHAPGFADASRFIEEVLMRNEDEP